MSNKLSHEVLSAASINASGNSGALPNLGQNNPDSLIVVDIFVNNAPTGTSPTLTFSFFAKDGKGHKYALTAASGTFSALNAQGGQRVTFTNVPEPNLELDWAIGGSASPTFSSVDATIYFLPAGV